MANDPFLTKKSIAGLAERVLLSPPPETVKFTISNQKMIITSDFEDILDALKIGQIAYGVCSDGGVLFNNYAVDDFTCIIQKISDYFCWAFGFVMDNSVPVICARTEFLIDLSGYTINKF